MAVPFGFSVGDMIAGISALVTIFKAIREAGGSAAQCQAIVAELETLRTTLSSVQSLRDEQRNSEEYISLCEVAVTCEASIKLFASKIAKYEPWLKSGTNGWKTPIRKVQWALCTTKDITEFRQQLTQQISTVCLKILAVQAQESSWSRQMQERCHDMIKATCEKTTAIQLKVLQTDLILEHISSQQLKHGEAVQQLIQQNKHLLQTNQQLGVPKSLLLAMILETQQKLLLHQDLIPPQVLLQQPVRLKCDTFVLPIHLDFVDSLPAFIVTILVMSRQRGGSQPLLSKIENLEFELRVGKTLLSLNQDWHTLFRPGQTVHMSKSYYWFVEENECPGCGFENESNLSGSIIWYNAVALSISIMAIALVRSLTLS